MSEIEPADETNHNNSLLEHYRSMNYHYDELCQSENSPRKHWEHFIQALDALGVDELEHRRREAHQKILDNGVSYNVYEDPQETDRPWELDFIPTLIESQEWALIEQGLIQRAELLNLIFKDIYGPRELIRKGLIPQEVVYQHPGFSRACCGIPYEHPHPLVVYAADIVRNASGEFRILSDRTQAPSGSGYALENRMVTSRILPSLFRDSQVHRLALYFRTLRMTLASIAPEGIEDPNIVILSPGTHNETYFEHAYLANYLGMPLVQGSDLTVRKGQVWLRSLDGLQRVHVILRRMDDIWSDPLEFKADSQIGVSGLLEAARNGHVVLANPLGCSVLENPGLIPFLPAIAKHFLGAGLLIPSAETYWCGNPDDLAYVLDNLDSLVIKGISPLIFRGRFKDIRFRFPEKLNESETERLVNTIKANPDLFVAQCRIAMSTVPAYQDGAIVPKPSILRSFAVARDDAYVVLPGGLTRITQYKDQLLISYQTGGISKDTWVLASEPEKQVTLWTTSETAVTADKSEGSLSSRIAESLFWLGRYAERSETLVRLLRKIWVKWIETFEYDQQFESDQCDGLQRLVEGVLKTKVSSSSQLEREFIALVQDPKRHNSLIFNLQSLLKAANSVRERLSGDSWYSISIIKEQLHDLRGKRSIMFRENLEELDAIIGALMAFSGLSMESLSRDQDWVFLDLGRRIERSQNLVELLRGCLTEPCSQSAETTLLESLLVGSESLMTYRRRYRSNLHLRGVLDLLLLDERHPRSLIYQLSQIQLHVQDLPGQKKPRLTEEEKLILQAGTRLRLVDITELTITDKDTTQRSNLFELLTELDDCFMQLSNKISGRYFTHIQPARQLAPLRRESGL